MSSLGVGDRGWGCVNIGAHPAPRRLRCIVPMHAMRIVGAKQLPSLRPGIARCVQMLCPTSMASAIPWCFPGDAWWAKHLHPVIHEPQVVLANASPLQPWHLSMASAIHGDSWWAKHLLLSHVDHIQCSCIRVRPCLSASKKAYLRHARYTALRYNNRRTCERFNNSSL
jgi:hypothetical protein